MSERQVQYTDGSWSREVEVTGDLLDRARRQVRGIKDPSAREQLIIDLIERVQQAEADVRWMTDSFTSANESCQAESRAKWEAMAERDAARGKLDKVRDWAHHIRTTRQRGDIEYNAAADVLAILDGKTGD